MGTIHRWHKQFCYEDFIWVRFIGGTNNFVMEISYGYDSNVAQTILLSRFHMGTIHRWHKQFCYGDFIWVRFIGGTNNFVMEILYGYDS